MHETETLQLGVPSYRPEAFSVTHSHTYSLNVPALVASKSIEGSAFIPLDSFIVGGDYYNVIHQS
jgi:hypothetical protein